MGSKEQKMSSIEESFAEGFIETIQSAKPYDQEIQDLRSKQQLHLFEAYEYYQQYPAVISYLNNDDANYFMNWLTFYEKRKNGY